MTIMDKNELRQTILALQSESSFQEIRAEYLHLLALYGEISEHDDLALMWYAIKRMTG